MEKIVKVTIIDTIYNAYTREDSAIFKMDGKEVKAIRLYEGMDRDFYFDTENSVAFYVQYDEERESLVAEVFESSTVSFNGLCATLKGKENLTVVPFDGVALQNGANVGYEFYGMGIWLAACSCFVDTYGWGIFKDSKIFKIHENNHALFFIQNRSEMFFLEV